jgi:hypothetical protein
MNQTPTIFPFFCVGEGISISFIEILVIIGCLVLGVWIFLILFRRGLRLDGFTDSLVLDSV